MMTRKQISKLLAIIDLFILQVMKLIETDIFRQAGIWKDEVWNLRDMISALERQGYSNLHGFQIHIDYQLYKALEHQYILGLSEAVGWLPDFNVELTFWHQQLFFRPALEEIRSKFFQQLRKFLAKPEGFRGVSDAGHQLFKIMVERNQHQFLTLYEKADLLFTKLENYKLKWLPLISLGCVEIEEMCERELINWEDWDVNFKRCKGFSQQITKISR